MNRELHNMKQILIVDDDQTTRSGEYEGPMEIVGIARLVGVDEYEIVGFAPARFRREIRQCVERSPLVHEDPRRVSRPSNVLPRQCGTAGFDFQ